MIICRQLYPEINTNVSITERSGRSFRWMESTESIQRSLHGASCASTGGTECPRSGKDNMCNITHCFRSTISKLIVHVKAVAACQRTMRACGLLQALCDILMASGVPADVLTETINTVAEVIRGNASNQEFLASVMAPSTPPRYN